VHNPTRVKVFKKYGWRKIAVIQVGRISFDLAKDTFKKDFNCPGGQTIKEQTKSLHGMGVSRV
jgi:hypothetical protein